MATKWRPTSPVLAQIATAINSLKTQIGAGALFHLDVSDDNVTASNASDAATLLTLTNNIITVYRAHLEDPAFIEGGALSHKVADTAPSLTIATDTASCITALNAIKADYNTHRTSTTYHYNADSTNAVTSSDATDQASAITLANEIKTDLNAHIASAPSGSSIRMVSA